MKKNIFNVLVVLLAFCCLFVGCDNPANSSGENTVNTTPQNNTEGWYEYVTNANTNNRQITYFYVKSTGQIDRAGNYSTEYFGEELLNLQNQFSWTICRNLADNSNGAITFRITEPPFWADNSNNNVDNGNDNEDNPNDGNNNDAETDFPTEDNEPEITLPTGCEWWCFEKACLDNGNYVSIYNYYEGETCTRTGIPSKELTNDSKNSFYLNISKTSAISNYTGNYYKVTNLSTLPSWCY